MAHWVVVVSARQYAAERLFANDTVQIAGLDRPLPAPGDDVLLVAAGTTPVLFGLGRATTTGEVAYTHRVLDAPLPAGGLAPGGPGAYRLSEGDFTAVAGKVGAGHRVDGPKREWLVSLDLPIEASSAAEAVRTFWTYVTQLGPRELPAFVSPADDELAMQAYVLGDETNLDPEEDEDSP